MERYSYGDKNQSQLGTLAWAGLAVYVAVADRYCEETLTHAFRRGVENSHTKPFVLGAMAVTAAHLLDILPDPIDPFPLIEKVGKSLIK